MKTRREFLQISMGTAVLPIAATLCAVSRRNFYKVIYDERFQASISFGRKMHGLGEAVHAMHGDVTNFWFHDLDLQWKERPVPIAGLTAHGALFCLERLAWDRGMRVMVREVQREMGDGEPLIYWTIAPKDPASV